MSEETYNKFGTGDNFLNQKIRVENLALGKFFE